MAQPPNRELTFIVSKKKKKKKKKNALLMHKVPTQLQGWGYTFSYVTMEIRQYGSEAISKT